jgi:hypothetical protein
MGSVDCWRKAYLQVKARTYHQGNSEPQGEATAGAKVVATATAKQKQKQRQKQIPTG